MFKPSVASWLVLPPCSNHRPGTLRTEPIGLPLSQCSRPGWGEVFEAGERDESPECVSLDRREEHDEENAARKRRMVEGRTARWLKRE